MVYYRVTVVRDAFASRNEVVGAENFLNLVEGFLHLLSGVSGHEAESDECVLRSHGRCHNGIDEDALVEEVAGDGECLEVVADEEGDDGG